MRQLLPNHFRATVAVEKLTSYLLDEAHPDGGSKARFLKRFGYDLNNWPVLSEALLEAAHTGAVSEIRTTVFCTKYTIRARLRTPDGRNPIVVTVWKIDNGEELPKFVTAYPG
jgi:hypothetical protein